MEASISRTLPLIQVRLGSTKLLSHQQAGGKEGGDGSDIYGFPRQAVSSASQAITQHFTGLSHVIPDLQLELIERVETEFAA